MLILSRKRNDGLVIRIYDDSGKLLETVKVKVMDARGVVKLGCEGDTKRVKFLREEIADVEPTGHPTVESAGR